MRKKNKYYRLLEDLETTGTGKMTCFGKSMIPIFESGETLTFVKQDDYEVGDCVFCKVKGRFIDAHKIIKKNKNKGYLIANNSGHENGWTHKVFAKVIR